MSGFRPSFLLSCEAAGSTTTFCECSLTYVEANVPVTDLAGTLAYVAVAGSQPPWFIDAANACAGQ
jgi:hypothetical protein